MNVTTSLSEIPAVEKLREEELDEARAIQNAMFPVESLRANDVRITHEFQPVASVGGDFLDYFQLADGSIGLYIGDVSGKGLPAAMYAALAVGALRGVHKTGEPPGKVLSTLNRRLLVRGMPAGLFEVAKYETATLKLKPGDSVIFCTDGITEAFNVEGESFGLARVAAICEAELKASPPKFLSQIFEAVEGFTRGREQHDDMAAAVFQYAPRL